MGFLWYVFGLITDFGPTLAYAGKIYLFDSVNQTQKMYMKGDTFLKKLWWGFSGGVETNNYMVLSTELIP